MTRFSDATLRTVEHWRRELDGSGDFGVPIPADWAPALRSAQTDIAAFMAPSDLATVERELMMLRSSTQLRKETAEEADVSFKVLCANLVEVPADILRRACRRYIRAPGTRFFPRSPGEILSFTNPLLFDRRRMIHRLSKMADAAEQARDEQLRREQDNRLYTLDELRVIPRDMRGTAVAKGWATESMCEALDAEAGLDQPISIKNGEGQ